MEALKSGVGVPCGIAYTYYAVRRLPRGFPRLVAVIPVVVMYIILPWQVSTLHMKGFTGFAFMWIGSFRLLMLCFDVGPLATHGLRAIFSISWLSLYFLSSFASPILKTILTLTQ